MAKLRNALLHLLTRQDSKEENSSTELKENNWELIGEAYAPPIPYPVTLVPQTDKFEDFHGGYYTVPASFDSEKLCQLSLGVTTFIWQNTETGDIKTLEVLGRDAVSQRQPTEHIMDKIIEAATESPQRFSVGDNDFLLGLVPKEEKLPLK